MTRRINYGSKESIRRINLGCGSEILEGYENYDDYMDNKPDGVKYINLNVLPLPFEDNSIDEIVLHDVLEHLYVDRMKFFEEIHRILKVGGTISVRLPTVGNAIQHVTDIHTENYLSALFNKNTPFAPRFKLVYLKKIKEKNKGQRLKETWYRIHGYFRTFFYRQYEWKLEKIEDD